nr:TPA_asm: m47.3 uORF [Murid betaherpesvirus 1]DBA07984.1 TPA_asm: m47.3 uORF [Murid betaherpesvirus 1]
MANTTPG